MRDGGKRTSDRNSGAAAKTAKGRNIKREGMSEQRASKGGGACKRAGGRRERERRKGKREQHILRQGQLVLHTRLLTRGIEHQQQWSLFLLQKPFKLL